MCLGDVGRVSEVTGPGTLTIQLEGRTVTVSAMLLDSAPVVGEWVLVHAGFALGKLTAAEAHEALDIRRAATPP
jgi:hydrogenase expression/formation protein HypC